MTKELLKQLREQLGIPGITGAALLALSGTFLLMTIKPLERETEFMRSRLDVAHSKSALHSTTFSLDNRQKELGAFFASLPDEEDVTDVLASIYASAGATGVEINQADYKPEAQNHTQTSYGMVFPVRGDYAKIRLFVSSVLVNNPAIALDQINFQRDKINDTTFKAEIRFSLYLRPAGVNEN